MLGTSMALTTASSSTSHMSAILRLFASVTGRSLRSTSASGWMPMERSAATECCVGLVFCSPDAPMNGTSDTCTKNTFLRPSSWRIWRADSMNGCDSMSPTVPPISVMMTSGFGVSLGLQAHAALDLVGDVRDDLHGVAEVLAAALAGDHLRVDLARRDVRGLAELDVEEALVVADVEVGLRAVVGHEDLAVLERVHRARVDVEIRVELLHDHAQSASGEQVAEACRRQALAQRGNDTACHEDVLGGVVRSRGFRGDAEVCITGFDPISRNRGVAATHLEAAEPWQQLSGVGERRLRVGQSREQARHLGFAIRALEPAHIGCRDRAVAGLDDGQVVARRTPRPARGE